MRFLSIVCFGILVSINLAFNALAMEAPEILRKSIEKNIGESFRLGLKIEDVGAKKGKKSYYAWFMGVRDERGYRFFLEFDEPEERAGMRFLLEAIEGKDDRGFMYLPTSKKVLPLSPRSSKFDIAGTGLRMDDFPTYMDEEIENAKVVGQEKVGQADCWVVSIPAFKGKKERKVWINKVDFNALKIQQRENSVVVRESNTLKFFTTAGGEEMPREMEIVSPGSGRKIMVVTENGVKDVIIPEELFDPKVFGTHKWRI